MKPTEKHTRTVVGSQLLSFTLFVSQPLSISNYEQHRSTDDFDPQGFGQPAHHSPVSRPNSADRSP